MSVQPSEFARGWRLVAGSLLGVSAGVSSLYFYSLGIFIKPLSAEFGWSRGDASLGVLIGTLCAAAMAYPTGRFVDRFGGLPVALISLGLLSLGFAALGAATINLWSFLILTAMVSVVTVGSTPLPYTGLIIANFHRNRGVALGMVLAGAGLGAILVPMLLTPFIDQYGWRFGYFALAGV